MRCSMKKEYLWVPASQRKMDPSRVGLIQLAYPILLESILRSTVNLIDIAFLSRVSDGVVSAVSVSGQYIMLCQMLASAVATGTLVCINQAIGMKNKEKIDRFATIALAANTTLGLLFGLIFILFSGQLLTIMRLDHDTIEAAGRYMRIGGGLMVFQCVEVVFSSICRSMGRTKAPLAINVTANLINLVGNYLAVYHPEFTGLDPVSGVAAASVLSRVASMALASCIAWRAGVRVSFGHLLPFPMDDLRLALSIGIPGGLNNMAYSLSQLVTTSIISLTGTVMVATKVYVNNLVHYVALVGMAFSGANSLMVGYRVGAGNYQEANEIRGLVTRIAVCSNAFFSLLMLLFRIPLMHLFTQNETIIQIAAMIFVIDFFVEIGRALNNSIAGALQATGDVKYQMVVNQLSGWFVSVGGAYVLGIILQWGLYGVWIAFALDELTRGLILLRRWKSQKWVEGAEKRRKMISSNQAAG